MKYLAALVKLAHNLIQKFDEDSSGQMVFPDLEHSYKPKERKPVKSDQMNFKNIEHVKDFQIGFDDVFGMISEDIGFDAALVGTEIQLHRLELERVELAIIDSMFDLLANRGEVVKKIVSKTETLGDEPNRVEALEHLVQTGILPQSALDKIPSQIKPRQRFSLLI